MTGFGPQQNSPWPPAAGPAYPPAPRRSSRGPVIIAAAIIGAALIVAGVVVATRDSGGSSPASPTPSATSSTAAAALVQVVPATLLPTADQVRQATLIDVKYTSEVTTKVSADLAPTPAPCAVAAAPTTLSAWATAISIALQRFGDGADYAKSTNFGVVAVAIFDTPAAAADSFTKVSDSVKGCTSFTTADSLHPGGTLSWTVSDVAAQEGLLAWTDTQTGVSSQWKCSKSYQLQVNAAAYAMVCGTNPGAGPSTLTGQIVVNATKK